FMKACYLIVMGFRHLRRKVHVVLRLPTLGTEPSVPSPPVRAIPQLVASGFRSVILLPAHSQGLVAVSSVALPHDRSRLRTRLHSLARHFYDSLLLRSNGLSSVRANCRDEQAATYSAARPLAGARSSLIDRAAARSVLPYGRTSFAEPSFL